MNYTENSLTDLCPLCNGPTKSWKTKRNYHILRCIQCENAFIPNRQVPDGLSYIYSKDYFIGKAGTGYPGYISDQQIIEQNFRDRMKWISSLVPTGRLLEVGCAYGFFLKVAMEWGWEVRGIEIAADCAKEAAKLSGAEIMVGDFLQVAPKGPFDVIVMFDVIEHLSDPIACFKHAYHLLRPGGLLVVETGDRNWPWARLLGNYWYFLDPPQHRFYFSLKGLLYLLSETGFDPRIRIRRLGRRVSFSNIIFKLSSNLPEGSFKESIIRRSRRRIPGSIYLNFGDGMVVAAFRNHLCTPSRDPRHAPISQYKKASGKPADSINRLNIKDYLPCTTRTTIFTVDVEDWYHANFRSIKNFDTQYPSRCVERGVDRILEILYQIDGTSTFFILGCVAERHPTIVKRIVENGHEVACHGWEHRLVYEQSPNEFENDIHRARSLLCDLSGQAVVGYRAPSWSITEKSFWAFERLKKVGFKYDSSIFPSTNYLYGVNHAPRVPYRISVSNNESLMEFPPSIMQLFGHRIGVGGGFYLRVLPIWLQQLTMQSYHKKGIPFLIYTHPREFDPVSWDFRLPLSLKEQMIHRFRVSQSEPKLRQLISTPTCSITDFLENTSGLARLAVKP